MLYGFESFNMNIFFCLQPLYETQNIRRDYQKRVSSSSQSSQGSTEPVNQYQQAPSSGHYQQQPPHINQYPPPSGQPYPPPPSQPYSPPPGQSYQHNQPPGMSAISNNLSELDQLLSDLNSAQFMAEVDKKHPSSGKFLTFD